MHAHARKIPWKMEPGMELRKETIALAGGNPLAMYPCAFEGSILIWEAG